MTVAQGNVTSKVKTNASVNQKNGLLFEFGTMKLYRIGEQNTHSSLLATSSL